MILAGLQKNSFIDYPGKIACVLFTTGCNFTCPYCHNPALARGEYPMRIEPETIMAFLQSRKGMLEGVTITGGEPTLHRGDLPDLCKAIKAMGYPVKMDTNGSRPEVLEALLHRHLVDFVAMDIKAPLGAYGPFCPDPDVGKRLSESIRLIRSFAPSYEFRTTCVAPFIDSKAVVAISETIKGAERYVLQPFNSRGVCLDPEFGRRHDPAVDGETMEKWKALILPNVQNCTIRA